jgi:uncharacterized protein (DUF1697 family)
MATRKKPTKAGSGSGTGKSRAATATHVVLLRGINVAGKNMLPMAELTRLLEQVGCRDVRTYIQSGNAVCSASAPVARSLATKLSAAIEARHGLRVPVVVRTVAELRVAAKANPFLAEGEDLKRLNVAFLQQPATAGAGKALDPGRSPPDRFTLRGRELYLCLPNGVGKTKYTSDYLDRTLGTVCTIRNWNTVLALCELAEG